MYTFAPKDSVSLVAAKRISPTLFLLSPLFLLLLPLAYGFVYHLLRSIRKKPKEVVGCWESWISALLQAIVCWLRLSLFSIAGRWKHLASHLLWLALLAGPRGVTICSPKRKRERSLFFDWFLFWPSWIFYPKLRVVVITVDLLFNGELFNRIPNSAWTSTSTYTTLTLTILF